MAEPNIIQELKEVKNSQEVGDLIEKHYPGWIVYGAERYSEDYSHLQKNWEKICGLSRTTPKKILLVKSIVFDRSPLSELCNMLTYNGFCVRCSEDFIVCDKCMNVIPSAPIWEQMRAKKVPVPEEWSARCSKCSPVAQ